MDNRPHPAPAGGIALDDIYYVLFRHKWKIILLFLAGIGVAAAVYRLKPPDYQSEAKLMIKYVVDNTSPAPTDKNAQMQSTDPQGQTIMNSEIQILTSLDVAKKVAEDLGPEKIMAKFGGSHDIIQAAGFISEHLKVEQEGRSSVITLNFKHRDPEMVVPILSQIIAEYKTKHQEIHQPGGAHSEFFTSITQSRKSELEDVDRQLKKIRDGVGVVSTEAALANYQKQIEKIGEDIIQARSQLAFAAAQLDQMTKLTSGRSVTTNANTNITEKPAPPPVPADVAQEYTRLGRHLAMLEREDDDLIQQHYLPESTPVTSVRAEIKKVQDEKRKLEAENPGLTVVAAQILANPSNQSQPGDAAVNFTSQIVQVQALQTSVKSLEALQKEYEARAAKIEEVQPKIEELELQKKQVEDDLQSYSKSLKDARINDLVEAGKAPNIEEVQSPSPPGRDWKKRYKAMEMLVMAGLGGGIAWAFLIEFFFDTSIKRAKDVKTKLGMPVFLSIPEIASTAPRRRALTNGQLLLKNGNGDASNGAANGSEQTKGKLEVAPWDHGHVMHPFYEALRDRLLGYFEAKNLTHNPKLVAVTGSSKGAGATTLAMGLAASLSETGDGNVLLVDMNQEHGASQHFYKGKPDCGLDDVLEVENRETALVQENLYVVNVNSNSDHLPRILPKRFASLVPKFKASDFDYIIFDMPPISQTSVTLRLAGFMDTTLLVVESEKTRREAVLEASALLAEAKANVNVVLNKTRSYIPSPLHQEF